MGKTIPGEVRTVLLKVLRFLEKEKKLGYPFIPVEQVLERATTATGVSKMTLVRIRKEAKKIEAAMKAEMALNPPPPPAQAPEPETAEGDESGKKKKKKKNHMPEHLDIVLPTPGLKRRSRSNAISLNETELKQLHHIVLSCTTGKTPKFRKIFEIAQRDLNFRGKLGTLRRIIVHKLGYVPSKGKAKRDAAKAAAAEKGKKGAKKQQPLDLKSQPTMPPPKKNFPFMQPTTSQMPQNKPPTPMKKQPLPAHKDKTETFRPHNISFPGYDNHTFPGHHFMSPLNAGIARPTTSHAESGYVFPDPILPQQPLPNLDFY